MSDLSILYPSDVYRMVGSKVVKLPELVLRRHTKATDSITSFILYLPTIGTSKGVIRTIALLNACTKLMYDALEIMYDDLDADTLSIATLPQCSQNLIDVWTEILAAILFAQKRSSKLTSKATDKIDEESAEGSLIKTIDLLFHQYGWTKDYIWNSITMNQIILLAMTIIERKQEEIKMEAALHGIQLDGSNKPSKDEKKQMQQSYGRQIKVPEEELLGIQPGNISGLRTLAMWLGVTIPDAIDVESNESNIRILLKNRLNDLEKANKLPNIDLAVDPVESCYGLGEGNIIGIKEKLEELGVKTPNIEAIKRETDTFKTVLMAHYISNLNNG